MATTDQDIKNLTNALEKMAHLLEGVGGEFDATRTRADSFAKQTKRNLESVENSVKSLLGQMATTSKLFREAVSIIPDTLSKSFGSSFKTIGRFENQIYLSSVRLSVLNKEFISIGRTQQIYRGHIDAITKATYLSTLEAKSLFDQLNSGFTGIKTEATVKQIADITINMSKLGLTAEETQKKIQAMGNALNFNQMKRALAGNASSKDMGDLFVGATTGVISNEAFFTATEANSRNKMYGGRETAELDARRSQVSGNRAFAEAQAITQNSAARGIVTLGIEADRLGIEFASLTAKVEVLSEVMGSAAKIVTPFVGSIEYTKTLPGLFGGVKSSIFKKGGGDAMSAASGLAGLAGGRAGGAIARATGNVVDVYVVNMPGSIGSGVGASGNSATGPLASGGAVAATGMAARLAPAAKLLRGAKLPIIGGLIAGGLTAADPDFEGATNKIGAGVLSGGMTTLGMAGGAAAGASLGAAGGPVGIAAGTIIGGIIGSGIGDIVGTKVAHALYGSGKTSKEDRIEEPYERKKREMELAAAGNVNNGDDYSQLLSNLEESVNKFGLMAQAAEKVSSSIGAAVSLMGQIPALADTATSAINKQVSLKSEEIKMLDDQIGKMEEQYRIATEKNEIDKANSIRMSLDEVQSKRQTKYYEQQLLSVEGIKRPFEDRIKLQQVSGDLASAELERNKALRMGIGVNYEDTKRVVQALGAKLAIEKQEVVALEKQARIEKDPIVRKQLEMEAAQAQQRALQTETKMLEEARSMREGYLDSLEETVAGLGAYAKILPKQGRGNQFFADSPSLGRVATSDANAAISSQSAIRFGPTGLMISQDQIESFSNQQKAYSRYNDSFLYNLQPTTDQLYGNGSGAMNSRQIQMASLGGIVGGSNQTYGPGGVSFNPSLNNSNPLSGEGNLNKFISAIKMGDDTFSTRDMMFISDADKQAKLAGFAGVSSTNYTHGVDGPNIGKLTIVIQNTDGSAFPIEVPVNMNVNSS